MAKFIRVNISLDTRVELVNLCGLTILGMMVKYSKGNLMGMDNMYGQMDGRYIVLLWQYMGQWMNN